MYYTITIKHDNKLYKYLVKHTLINHRREHFELIARNRSIIIESNRPLFRNKGLKHRRYDLTLVNGNTEVWNMTFVQKIYEQLHLLISTCIE
jgi:hypothetical protein